MTLLNKTTTAVAKTLLPDMEGVLSWSPEADEERAQGGFRKRDHYLNRDGRPLWIREIAPTGPAHDGVLVFVHGNTFPAVCDFDLEHDGGSLVERLARLGFRSVLFDHLGFGRSYKPKTGLLDTPQRARDLEVVIDYLEHDRRTRRLTIAALSSAVMPVVELLRRRRVPQLVSLVLLGPAYIATPELLTLIRRLQVARLVHRLRGDPDCCYWSLSRKSLLCRLAADQDEHISLEMVQRFIDTAIEATDPGAKFLRSPVVGFLERRRLYRRGERLCDAGVIDRPVLLMRGERDDFCTLESAAALRNDLVHGELVEHVIPEVKHDLGLYPDQRSGAYDELCRFLEQSWGGAHDGK